MHLYQVVGGCDDNILWRKFTHIHCELEYVSNDLDLPRGIWMAWKKSFIPCKSWWLHDTNWKASCQVSNFHIFLIKISSNFLYKIKNWTHLCQFLLIWPVNLFSLLVCWGSDPESSEKIPWPFSIQAEGVDCLYVADWIYCMDPREVILIWRVLPRVWWMCHYISGWVFYSLLSVCAWMIQLDWNMTWIVDIQCVRTVVELLSRGRNFLAAPLTGSIESLCLCENGAWRCFCVKE